jgi:predicted O-methyltransferase YrrM
MHTPDEAALLARLAAGRRRAVEIGVYEGSSAVVLAASLPPDATLHLVDPFTGNALRAGWRATEGATRRVVARAVRERGGPRVVWHAVTSAEAAAQWNDSVDLVFVDGDHTRAGAQADWESFSPWVEPGGVVIFHDAREGRAGGGGLPGPTAVVDAIRDGGERGWRVAAEQDSTVAFERLGEPNGR